MLNRILAISALLVLGLLNFAIYQKQTILKEGELILLKLEPLDPRSIMQGDYMAFRYALSQEISPKDAPTKKHGYIVIKADENQVGHFVRFYQEGEALQDNEKLLKYKYNQPYQTYTFKPDSYLFQEGRQSDFQKAKYAVFHYQGVKDYLLIGLTDEDFNYIQ